MEQEALVSDREKATPSDWIIIAQQVYLPVLRHFSVLFICTAHCEKELFLWDQTKWSEYSLSGSQKCRQILALGPPLPQTAERQWSQWNLVHLNLVILWEEEGKNIISHVHQTQLFTKWIIIILIADLQQQLNQNCIMTDFVILWNIVSSSKQINKIKWVIYTPSDHHIAWQHFGMGTFCSPQPTWSLITFFYHVHNLIFSTHFQWLAKLQSWSYKWFLLTTSVCFVPKLAATSTFML